MSLMKTFARQALLLAILAGLACQSTSTPVPIEPTASLPPARGTATTIPPTRTPTPEPLMDLSWATVQATDLPSNIDSVQLPLDLISITSKDMLGVEFLNQQVFLSLHGVHVTGFVVDLSEEAEREAFMQLLSDTQYDSESIKEFAAHFYEDRARSLNSVDDSLKDVGDVRNSFVVNLESKYNEAVKTNLEVILFARGDVGVFLVNRYSIHTPGLRILSHVAHSVDARIEAAMQAGIPTRGPAAQTLDDLSWLTPPLSFDAFPAGTIQVDPGELELKDELDKGELDYDNLFVFHNENGPRTLLGYNFLLNSLDEVGAFDVLVTEVEALLEEFTASFGGEDMREYYQLYALEGAGDIQDGRTLIADVEGRPYQFSLVMFRDTQIANMLILVQPPVPRDFNFDNLDYPGIINIRWAAYSIGLMMDELYLYNTPADGGVESTPEPPSQTG